MVQAGGSADQPAVAGDSFWMFMRVTLIQVPALKKNVHACSLFVRQELRLCDPSNLCVYARLHIYTCSLLVLIVWTVLWA